MSLDESRAGPLVRSFADAYEIETEALDPERSLEDFVRGHGEPMLAALILHLERSLPEPFPEDLLAAVETFGELLAFADIKLSRAASP